MKKEEAIRAILDQWRRLPEDERTESNAAAFAMRMSTEYKFRCSGDPYQVIMGALSRCVRRGVRP